MTNLSLCSAAGRCSRFGISAQRQVRTRPPQLSFCLRTIFEGCTTNPQVSAFKQGIELIRKQNQTWCNRAHRPARQTVMTLLWPCSAADPARFPGTDRNGRHGRWCSSQPPAPRGALHTPGMLCSTWRQPSLAGTLRDGRTVCWEGDVTGGRCDGRTVRWDEGGMEGRCFGTRVRWDEGVLLQTLLTPTRFCCRGAAGGPVGRLRRAGL